MACLFVILAVSVAIGPKASAAEARLEPLPEGYIRSLQDEKEEPEPANVVLVPKPAPMSSIPLSDVIFDQKLKKEFTDVYREKFGYTEAERNLGLPLLYVENGIAQGRSIESERARAERRAFAEYMFRRLAEHHMDGYFRSDPNLKGVWELKERISNVEVKVSENFSLMTIYSYSGNFITVNANNPYVNVRLRYEMNPSSFGPSEMVETGVSLAKQITRSVHLETHYKIRDGVFSIIGEKWLAPAMKTTLQGSTDTLEAGTVPQENKVLAGFAYVY
ncbi:MAG TPA: hypothetical protein VFV50_09195 [Bdellovibrionales bacterium]|nr:hypothetical protein [Bdellovibrionales bacterium]